MIGLRSIVGFLALYCLAQSVRAESPQQRVTIELSTCGAATRIPLGGHLIVSDGMETLVQAKPTGTTHQVMLPSPATLFAKYKAPQIESRFLRFQTPTNGRVRLCVQVLPPVSKPLRLSASHLLTDQLKEGESFTIEYHLESCWNVETIELRIGKLHHDLVAWLSSRSRQRGACAPHPKRLSATEKRVLREFLQLVARPVDEAQKFDKDWGDALRVRFRGLQSRSFGMEAGDLMRAFWTMRAWFSCFDD